MGNKQPKLSKADLEELMQRTNFTKSQIKGWYRGFMQDCPSGELSRSKFLDIYQTLFPEGKADAFYKHVFRTFDADNSGKIDFKEFLQAISITQAGKPEEKLELAFRLYDIDRNGTIERNEMVEIIQAIFLMTECADDVGIDKDKPEERADEIFSKMDVNNDGCLNREEFIEGCLNDEVLFKLLTSSGAGDEEQS